jgi:hypothetical protein
VQSVVQSDFGSRGSEHSGRELFSESANICVHLRLKLLDLIRSSLFVFSEPYLAWDGKIFEPRIAQTALIFRVWILIDQHDFVSDRFVRFCEF